jgi:hypothetical protein
MSSRAVKRVAARAVPREIRAPRFFHDYGKCSILVDGSKALDRSISLVELAAVIGIACQAVALPVTRFVRVGWLSIVLSSWTL